MTCECGEEKVCQQKILIIGAGVLQTTSSSLVKCHRVKDQLVELSKITKRLADEP